MSYERVGLGAGLIPGSQMVCAPGQQKNVFGLCVAACPSGQQRNLQGQCIATPITYCDDYNCGQGYTKESFKFYNVGAEYQASRAREQGYIDRGCRKAQCTQKTQLITGSSQVTYCCPPDYIQQWNLEERAAIARRLANKTTLPRGSSCGTGGVTRGHRVYSCPPNMSCSAELSVPIGCVATGRWYDENDSEYCCTSQTTVPATPPPPSIVYSTPPVQQQVQQGRSPMFWIGLGCVGIGLILVLRKK